ncbi:MAG: PaaI family thioesterase [Pseudomonadota bacterium]|nr:PaaI family thioesterase [Pseudomonadota bacterium]
MRQKTIRDAHFRALEAMYLSAPINQFYRPRIVISKEQVEIDIDQRFFHAAEAVHGSVYFKLLDDAAGLAANVLEREVFAVTASFSTHMTRPVSGPLMRSVGRVVDQTRSQFLVESIVYDHNQRSVGRGNGVFMRGSVRLADSLGYRLE